MIVDMILANVFVELPLPQRVVVVDGRTHAIAVRNAGKNLPSRTLKALQQCIGSFSVCAIIGLAGPGKVGKVGQELKRDLRGYEEDACAPSFLDQVHVSETWLGDRDAVLCPLILSGVQIPLLLQSAANVSPSTSRKAMTKARPKRGAFSCWLDVAQTQRCSRTSRG